MKRRLLLLSVIGLAAGACPASRGAPPATHTVVIAGMRFEPATVSARAGDTVVWINKDLVSHTVTSAAGRFDSGEIGAAGSWKYTVESAGEFPYVCFYHPTMTGTVRARDTDRGARDRSPVR